MSVLDNFDQWKGFLADRIQQAKQQGMNQGTIDDMAHQIGDYLAEQVDPKNNEQRLLKELWDASTEQEQQTLASLMVKVVENENMK